MSTNERCSSQQREIPHAISSRTALTILTNEIHNVFEESEHRFKSWKYVKNVCKMALQASNETTLFPWPMLVIGLVQGVVLAFAAEDGWSKAQGGLVFVIAVANVALALYEEHQRRTELRKRLEHVLKQLKTVSENDDLFWGQSNYPHLHTPLSASAVLQWTYRDDQKVNLPWALLVKGDLILIKPGQLAPGKCHSLENPSVVMEPDQVLHIETQLDDEISPIPVFKPPAKPQLFVLDETPYVKIARLVLGDNDRPASLLHKRRYFFFSKILSYLSPILFMTALVVNSLRVWGNWSVYSRPDSSTPRQVLVDSICVTLPLLSLVFPFAWIVTNYIWLAKILTIFCSLRHVKITDDPFDDTVEKPDVIKAATESTMDWRVLWKYFVSGFLGSGEYLSRTENLVHTLGSVTSLCCTDKKGILSWPNTSAEKIFLLKKALSESTESRDDLDPLEPDDRNRLLSTNTNETGSPPTSAGLHFSGALDGEILNITPDHQNPFKVDFDDPSWGQYTEHLKPLGLSILLNTCNISTEERYTNFFNHLVCESTRVTQSNESEQQDKKRMQTVDMLPIVTRGCLCELPRRLGLTTNCTNSRFKLSNQVQTFRRVRADPIDNKFAKNLSLAKLKFPFPHMVSVTVQQRTTGGWQLFSQGTADIVLDSCTDAWSGKDLEPLSGEVRKKILDFYHRASLSSYCTAFSYRPLTFPIPRRGGKEYLQMPTHSLPFYWQYSEGTECADMDAINTHIPLNDCLQQPQDTIFGKTRADAMACLELQCNQTFLGMVQLQYQPVVDIVQLIDLLEKACIRFVHFSKENELRSRVFSEKMGLETGWNCHISLKSTTVEHIRRTLSYQSTRERCSSGKGHRKRTASEAERAELKRTKIGSSLPVILDRPAWFLDFPKWQELRGCNGDRKEGFSSQQQNELPNSLENLIEVSLRKIFCCF